MFADALATLDLATVDRPPIEPPVLPEDATDEEFEQIVWDQIKTCYDPEIPVNIVDLGLIYDLRIAEPDAKGEFVVNVKMTLTAQGCGMGSVIANDAKEKIEALQGVSSAQVDIFWDPPWTPHMISEEGRQKLDLE